MAIKKKGKAAKPKTKDVKDSLRVTVKTPSGRLLYPHLVEQNTQGKYPSNAWETQLLISKADWKKEGKELREAVLAVGRDYFQDPKLTLDDFPNPIKDGDDKEQELYHDHILIRAKNRQAPPRIVNVKKKDLDEDEIAAIKSGDYGRLVVTVAPYEPQGGGVTLYLTIVQYITKGVAIGGGAAAALELLDEVNIDDLEEDEEETDEEETEEDEDEDDESLDI